MKDLLAYLFGDSQIELEVEETRNAIERIMEEAEKHEPLKPKRTPLINALKSLGIEGVDKEIEYDPEGFSLKCGEEQDYRRYVRILMEPAAMENLAKLGWVITRCGDVAMSNEPAEFRIRFIEITTPDPSEDGKWPTPNPELVKNAIKKGREFSDAPGPHDEESPVEYDDKTSHNRHKGVGSEKDGADPEGKPKGSDKSEGQELADRLLSPVNESEEERLTQKQDQAFQNAARHPYPANQSGKEKRRFRKWSRAGQRWQDKAVRQYNVEDLVEGGHKAGCACAFCTKYKGKGFKKKSEEAPKEDDSAESKETTEPEKDGGVAHGSDSSGSGEVPKAWNEEKEPPRFDEAFEKGQTVRLKRGIWGHKPGTAGRIHRVLPPGHSQTKVNKYTAQAKFKGSPHMYIRPEDVE